MSVIDELDAARSEHGLQLGEAIGRLVVAVVAEKEDLERSLGGLEGGGREEAEERDDAGKASGDHGRLRFF